MLPQLVAAEFLNTGWLLATTISYWWLQATTLLLTSSLFLWLIHLGELLPIRIEDVFSSLLSRFEGLFLLPLSDLFMVSAEQNVWDGHATKLTRPCVLWVFQ